MKKEDDSDLNDFGRFLRDQAVDRGTAAKALRVSKSYISMLSRDTTPGLQLAVRIARWTTEAFGSEKTFGVDKWVQEEG